MTIQLKLITVPGGLRDSYVADYYDAAGRLTAEEDVGTNGGLVWTRPANPNPADASHLLTLIGYDAAGNQNSVTDPLGIVSMSSFDMLGQPVQTIADDSDPAGNPIQPDHRLHFRRRWPRADHDRRDGGHAQPDDAICLWRGNQRRHGLVLQ
jgi:hypothetical protein